MITAPVKRHSGYQVITQPFARVLTDRGDIDHDLSHLGVDLRNVRFASGRGYVGQWQLQPIVAPEKMLVKRFGVDEWGGFLVAEPLDTNYYELKFIHIMLDQMVQKSGVLIEAGERIGFGDRRGKNREYHLHFETLLASGHWVNPVQYFDMIRQPYKYKGRGGVK